MERLRKQRGVLTSPGALSLALSLVLHTALLAAPSLANLLGVSRETVLPRGDGPVAIEWMELGESPAPLPKPLKAVAQKSPPTPPETVPVLSETAESSAAAPETSVIVDSALSGSPSEKIVTLGSREGLSSEALKYHDELYLLFESRKTYPMAARRLNQQGEVLISLRIWANGKIDDQRVIRPCPYERLNEAALAMVRQVKQFKPLPEDAGPYAYFHLPIEYSLN